MLKLCCFIIGEDFHPVKHSSPISRKKVRLFAISLLLPVIMWFCSTFLLVNHVLEKGVISALIAALIASSLIYIIERSIVMSQGTIAIYIFRVTLGLFIAMIGSIAIDEVIFKDDIDLKVVEIKRDYYNSQLQLVDENNKRDLLFLEKDGSLKFNKWQKALKEAHMEADGTGGSKQRGISDITRLKLKNASLLEVEYKKAYEAIILKRNEISNAKRDFNNQFQSEFNEHSILLRVKAMMKLVSEDIYVLIIYVIFTLIIFAIEFLVIILKSSQPKSSYELKQKAIEKIAEDKLESITNFQITNFQPEVSSRVIHSLNELLDNKKIALF